MTDVFFKEPLREFFFVSFFLRQKKKELLNTDVVTESRKEEIKDNNGNVLRVEEVEVPVLVRHYEIWRKCKHCGHLVKIFEDEKEEKYNRTMLK